MKLNTLKSIVAAALAVVGLNANSASVEYTATIGDITSEPCVDATTGAKDNANQFANDISASYGKSYDLVQIGDSVTENWGTTGIEGSTSKLKIGLDSEYQDGVICMGIGGNRTQNIIYRCHNGTLDNYKTKYFTVLAGVNNIYQRIIDSGEDPDDPKNVAEAIRVILNCILEKHEESKILLMPILPYAFKYQVGTTYQALYRKGLRVRENTEEVNDLIMNFVDNKRVFWLDVRKDFVTEYGTPDFTKFGGPGGSYDPNQCLHPNTSFAYQYFNQAVTNAMLKYWNVAAGTAQCTDPSLGLVTSEQKGFSTAETINLSGIYLGTDSSATRVTSYSVAYELDGGSRVTALTNQSATRNSFDIPDVALGEHTVVVYVTTGDSKTITRTLKFTRYDGWTAEVLGTDDSQIRTDGTLMYAYARGNYTLNGVSFTSASGKIDNDNIYWSVGSDGGGQSITGTSGDYASMLKACWWATAGSHAVTLKSLTPGNQYLVQIIGCRNSDNIDGNVFIDESFQEKYTGGNFIKVHGTGWDAGGSLTGVFTADSTGTKTFTICSDGNHALNAVQVRDLGATGYIPVTVVNPSISSAAAAVDGASATISLTGIAMGTDDDGANASSYTLAYSLNGAASVTLGTGLSDSAYSFTLSDLADATYTCAVTVTTDAGKSVTKSVSFTIDNVPDPVSPSLAATAAVDGSNATITVSSVVLGTDSDCNAATKYTLTYALDGGAEVTVLADATVTSTTFALENLAVGAHSCVVKMTTDKATTASKTVSFTIKAATGGETITTGWTVTIPEDADGLFCTTGTLVYAYAPTALTVDGIEFAANASLDSGNVIAGTAMTGYKTTGFGAGGQSGSLGTMLDQAWYWDGSLSSLQLAIGGLTSGKEYLVQVLSHNGFSNVTIGGGDADKQLNSGSLGASVVGVFTASAASETISLTFGGGAGYRTVNAIQVRELGTGGSSGGETPVTPDPEEPEESVSFTLTIPSAANMTLKSVTTNGIAVTAASAGVYSIVSNTAVKVSFTAADGYEFTGDDYVTVTVTANMTLTNFPTVKAKESSGGTTPTMTDGWTAIAMTSDGSSVCTSGNLVYAYAMYDVTVNGVTFTGVGTGGINNDDCVTAFTSGDVSTTPPSDTAAGDYTKLLQYGWWKTVKDRNIVLNNLTAGKQYLVQLIGHRSDYTTGYGYISSYSDQHMRFGGTDYEYGGSLIGVFTATASSETITVSYNTQCYLNAIQVRDVSSSSGGDTGFTDWPTAAEITDSMTAADLKITSGSFTDATVAELRKLSTWGKANGVTFGGTEVNALSFDENGNPLNDFTKAYLLNCAETNLSTEEPKFKFASITPGVIPSIDDPGYNGVAKVEGSATLGSEASWEDADASKHFFFRARLIRK